MQLFLKVENLLLEHISRKKFQNSELEWKDINIYLI